MAAVSYLSYEVISLIINWFQWDKRLNMLYYDYAPLNYETFIDAEDILIGDFYGLTLSF